MLCTKIVIYFCPFCDGRYERGIAMHPALGPTMYLQHHEPPCTVYQRSPDVTVFARHLTAERPDADATQALGKAAGVLPS